jgi:glycosyltransferase involved in cell wall biosynthesis
MYLIPIRVPLFRDGDALLVQSDWRRAVALLRDSLEGRYGDLHLVSPWLSVDDPAASEQPLEPLDLAGVRATPVYHAAIRARHFWARGVRELRAAMARALIGADVVHAGLDELFRPMMGLSFGAASARGIPTVFVQDTDVVVQMLQLAGREPSAQLRALAYVSAYEQLCRRCVGRADLTLLKSGTLEKRYAPYAKNLMTFEDTSYLSSEVVAEEVVESRLGSLGEERPLRLVYCGRLIARKGVDVSVRIVAAARAMGARVEFEVIGSGPEEARLVVLARELGLEDVVRFTGSSPYGPALLQRLATFDGLLFTPTAEDTPRMIFDGYAAGLPLIAAPIPYVEERARAEHATHLLPQRVDAAARSLLALDRNRGRLAALTCKAREAALYHAADSWYRRRAERTHEVVERRRRRAS